MHFQKMSLIFAKLYLISSSWEKDLFLEGSVYLKIITFPLRFYFAGTVASGQPLALSNHQ